VTLRKVPGALALGLLASLAAHAALYGGGHAMGGAYNAAIVQAAFAGTLALLLGFAALAWSASGGAADGSVVAARLRQVIPGITAILAAALLWYAAAEALEPHHGGAPGLAALPLLVLTAWISRQLARWAAETLAHAVIAVTRLSFSPRTPSWNRPSHVRIAPRRPRGARRRFARPPPIAA
jgi:hypothetical protein